MLSRQSHLDPFNFMVVLVTLSFWLPLLIYHIIYTCISCLGSLRNIQDNNHNKSKQWILWLLQVMQYFRPFSKIFFLFVCSRHSYNPSRTISFLFKCHQRSRFYLRLLMWYVLFAYYLLSCLYNSHKMFARTQLCHAIFNIRCIWRCLDLKSSFHIRCRFFLS